LVLKALQKDPNNRFQSAGEMLSALNDPEAWYKPQARTTPAMPEASLRDAYTPVPVAPPIQAPVAERKGPVAASPKGKGNTSNGFGIWIGVGSAAILLVAVALWASHMFFGVTWGRPQGASNDLSTHSSEAPAVKPTQQAPGPENGPSAAVSSSSTPAAPPKKSAQVPSDKKAQAEAMYSEADNLINQQQFLKALPLATGACHAGVAAACTDLGSIYENGQGVRQDERKAKELYRQACDGGSARGCTLLGDQNEHPGPLHTDAAHALVLYRRGCDGGYASGCTKVAGLYEGFVAGAPPADFIQAASFALRGCSGGDAEGCLIAALVYKWGGNGLTQDKVRAAGLFQKGCDAHNFGACGELGSMYENGDGVAPDSTRAVTLLGEACDHNVGLGCRGLGDIYENGKGVAQDFGRAFTYYRKDCDSPQGGSFQGCMALAGLYRVGKGVAQDKAQAAAIYRKLCGAGAGVHEACDALRAMTK
jgi:TPR repeat protein